MTLPSKLRDAARYAEPNHRAFLLRCADEAEETLQDDVRAAHLKFGHPAPEGVVDATPELMAERLGYIKDEVLELSDAMVEGNLAHIAQESADVIYVVIGTLVALGIPLKPFWQDIHRANMEKEPAPDGGKWIKPEGWMGPRPARVLHRVRQQS